MRRLLLPLLLVACVSPAAVERVSVVEADGGGQTGTAVLVKTTPDASYWATNAHVTDSATPKQVAIGLLSVGYIWEVMGEGMWDGLYFRVDGSILETKPVKVTETEEMLGRWEPTPGERVTIRTLRGTLTALMRPHTGGYQFSVLYGEGIVPGDSGSPVFTGDGKLVGLVWASSTSREHVGVLTPIWAIREALSNYRLRWVLE